jgi:hypothetical protein
MVEVFAIAKKVGRALNVTSQKRIVEWPTVPGTVFVKMVNANVNRDGKGMTVMKVLLSD